MVSLGMVDYHLPMSDDLLKEFRDAVTRRSKSLKRALRAVELEEIVDQVDGRRGLQLSVAVWSDGKSPTLRLQLWSDRWVWFDARQAGSPGGWKWTWTTDGRLLSGRSARDLLDAFQVSRIHLLQGRAGAAEVWAHVLASEAGDRRKVQLATPDEPA